MILLYIYLASVLSCWLAIRHCTKEDYKNGVKVEGKYLIRGIIFMIIPVVNMAFAFVIFFGFLAEKLENVEISDKLARAFFLIRKDKKDA